MLNELLKENSGMLSRMKERDSNDELARVLEEILIKELQKELDKLKRS